MLLCANFGLCWCLFMVKEAPISIKHVWTFANLDALSFGPTSPADSGILQAPALHCPYLFQPAQNWRKKQWKPSDQCPVWVCCTDVHLLPLHILWALPSITSALQNTYFWQQFKEKHTYSRVNLHPAYVECNAPLWCYQGNGRLENMLSWRKNWSKFIPGRG